MIFEGYERYGPDAQAPLMRTDEFDEMVRWIAEKPFEREALVDTGARRLVLRSSGAPLVAAYAVLAYYLNGLVERGERVAIDEVHEHIEDGTLFGWLDATFDPIDVSAFEADGGLRGHAALEYLERLSNAADPASYVVESNGLSLLSAYCIEAIQARVRLELQ